MNRLGEQLRRPRNGPAGFTLIEVVLAAAIVAIILLGLHSAMLLASRAAPDRSSANNAAVRAGRAIDQIAVDLAFATSITTATTNTIEFVVPDRNNNGSPETIAYSWSGTAGDPLLRTINLGAAATLAADVREFQLFYDKRPRARSTTYTESGEVLLSSYDSLLNLSDGDVDYYNWWGQYFKPTLPNGATHFRVTRVKFRARTNSSSDGVGRIQIRTASGLLPGTVIEEASMYESNLTSSYSWQEFSFSNVSGRPAGTGLCLVIQPAIVGDIEPCRVQYQGLLASGSNAILLKTSNAGQSWTALSGQDMRYYVYGAYSTPDPVAYDYWLTGVRCTLRSGSDPAGPVRTTIRVLNEPQVSGP